MEQTHKGSHSTIYGLRIVAPIQRFLYIFWYKKNGEQYKKKKEENPGEKNMKIPGKKIKPNKTEKSKKKKYIFIYIYYKQ